MNYINEFLYLSDQLGDKYEVQAPKPTVVVLGSYNSGKSTLINGLLQTRISPVDIVPRTKGPIRFQYGKNFYAKVNYGKFKSKNFKQQSEFQQFLAGKKSSPFEMAEVFLNNDVLKKMTLIDTPGLDGPFIQNCLQELIKAADHLVYLFHQRGIEEFNKRWLLKSICSLKPSDIPKMSFWINCNLGNFDGTSIEETRTVLQEIFSGSQELYTVNTLDIQNLALFRLYLESVFAVKVMRQVRQVMLRKDMSINQHIEQAVNTPFEAEFLLQYSRIRQTVLELLQDKDNTNFTPYILHLKKLLESNNISNITKLAQRPPVNLPQKSLLSFTEIKGLLLDLINRILSVTIRSDKGKQTVYPIKRTIEELAGKIKKERFTIVATGGFSSGKSTFFNALMCEEVLPAQNKPTTYAITQISYGDHKKAVVHFSTQVTLQLYDKVKGKLEPRIDELNALSQWIKQNTGEIKSYEIHENRRFKNVSHAEFIKILRAFQEISSCRTALQIKTGLQENPAMGSLSVSSKYKTVSLKLFPKYYLPEKVRLTFHQSETMSYDLETTSGVKAFQATINCSSVFRIKRVEVFHPAEYLKTATFLDTPGLDSTHKYHSEITTDYLQDSDIYLIFLNARHILLNQDVDNPVEMVISRIREYLKGNPRAYKKIFFILNFADTLTGTERKKVTELLRQRLSTDLFRIQIYTVSSLSALQKKDDGSFQSLLNDIELSVVAYRGNTVLSGYAQEIKYILNTLNSSSDANSITIGTKHLLNFNPTDHLLNSKSEMLKEVNQRFTQLDLLVSRLRSEQDFSGFLLGTRELKKLTGRVEIVSCMSYFQWAAELNNYIIDTCKKIINITEQYINSHLGLLYGTLPTAIHLTAVLPETIPVSQVLQKLSVALEQNRGLFGRLKERQIKLDINRFLTGEQQILLQNIEKWANVLIKEIDLKISPICTDLIENHIIPRSSITKSVQILPPVQKNYNPEFNKYLKEIKRIEALVEQIGGS